jgi:hypothetical protein
MDTLAAIIRDLLIVTGILFLLLIGVLVAAFRLPPGNPLKRTLTALALRLGASFGAGLLAIPIEPIPGLDLLYDLGAPAALLYFWYTFVRNRSRAARGTIIDHDPR